MNSNQLKGDFRTHEIYVKALMNDQRYEEALNFMKAPIGRRKRFHQNRNFEALIQELCRNKNDPEKGLSVLQEYLKIDGIVPSSFTFCSLIYSFSSQGKMDRVIEVLELMSNEKYNYPFDNFVCSSVISGFVRIGKPELGIGFFENAVKSGAVKPSVVTYTALLSVYIRLGRFEEVCDMVSRMEKDGLKFDVVFYSNWIYGYFREGIIGEAFQKYKDMVDRKIEIDTITYTILIDGFSKDGNVEKAVGFLHKMIKVGVRPNLVTYTAIILGFCKKGKLEEAFALFKMIKDLGMMVDEFIYLILIDGVCTTGDFDSAFQLLEEMEDQGIKPSIVMYNTIINGLCKAGRSLQADNMSQGIVGDVVTHSIILHGYIVEGNAMGVLETKRRIEASGICIDIVMCNILIKALFMLGLFDDVLAVYQRMPEMDLVASSVTYYTMINGYCKAGRIDEALEIFDDFRRSSYSSAACYNCIIQGLCTKGMVDMAIEVFKELVVSGLPVDRMLLPMLMNATFDKKGAEGVLNLIHHMENLGGESFANLCNDAIILLSGRGCSFDAVFNVFMVIRRNRFPVLSKSYYAMLKALLLDGKKLLSSIILSIFLKQYGLSEPRVNRILFYYMCIKNVSSALLFLPMLKEKSLDTAFSVNVLDMLIKNGRALDAYQLILGSENDKLFHMRLLDYSKLIDSLCKERHVEKALDLCNFVRSKGFSLSIAIYNSVLHGLCCQGCIVEALRLFDSLEKGDILPSEITYVILIDTLSKEGHLLDARKLFETMLHKNVKPNIRAYNSLIHGYCKLGQLQEALDLLLDLEVKCLQPDEFTFSAIIYGYCLKGDMEGSLDFFTKLRGKGTSPDFLGFMYLLRGLCAKGRMEESQSILREMLQTQSIVDLLNKVDRDIEMESAQSFLVFLCEQGSIQEAIAVLDEIGFTFFPLNRRPKTNELYLKLYEPDDAERHEANVDKPLTCSCDAYMVPRSYIDEKLQKVPRAPIILDRKVFQPLDLNSLYEIAASLCSKGETSEANRLVKIISGLL